MSAGKTSKLIAVYRLILWAGLSLFTIVTQTPLLMFYRGKYSFIVSRWWQEGTAAIFKIKFIVEGKPYEESQTLYVGNHMSHMDIPTIGSFVNAVFIARGDMEKWPVFGHLGKMQQTIYISRDRKKAEEGKAAIDRIVGEGKSIILFAEGTSTDGRQVVPFKSSLFSIPLEHPTMMVQAFTLDLIEVNGQSADDQAVRDTYTWHGDMTLEPHIWQFAQFVNGATVKVTFHKPRKASDYTDRKLLTQDCYNDVASALTAKPLVKAA